MDTYYRHHIAVLNLSMEGEVVKLKEERRFKILNERMGWGEKK